jgi:hypothetical protein
MLDGNTALRDIEMKLLLAAFLAAHAVHASYLASVPARTADEPDWLVCLGMHHEVTGGAVVCPLSESAVSVAGCLACRHLGNVSDERRASRWCAAGESDNRR